MSSKQISIAIIIPYYGQFPWYFDLFLHSVSFNPSVDIMIVTDLLRPSYCPDNVHFINMSLQKMQDLASQKLNLKAKIINNLYKLCDFRPAYGLIFSDFIKKYDFWGFGDIDIIYGNIRDFINTGLLSYYDFIGVRGDWVTGFFSLFRNTATMNTLFTKSKDYVKVFSEPEYYRFDECPPNVYNSLYHGVSIYNIRWDIESITYIVKKCNENKEIKACFGVSTMEGTSGKMMWNNGTLIYDNKVEVLFYHLIDFKKHNKGYSIVYEDIPNIYYIDSNRIRYNLI